MDEFDPIKTDRIKSWLSQEFKDSEIDSIVEDTDLRFRIYVDDESRRLDLTGELVKDFSLEEILNKLSEWKVVDTLKTSRYLRAGYKLVATSNGPRLVDLKNR